MDQPSLNEIQRDQIPLDPDEPDGETLRFYYAPDYDIDPLLSVTTVKEIREDSEKESAFDWWKDTYDGIDRRPWWRDQRMFKAYRGTLVHFTILDALARRADRDIESGTTYYHKVGDRNWGLEEYTAEYKLKKWSKFAPSSRRDDGPYTPTDNEYDGEHAWDAAMRGMTWATKAFKSAIIEGKYPSQYYDVESDYPKSDERFSKNIDARLNPENVLGVEEFVYDTDHGYAGQYDLLYETDTGKTVLADLKTSSGVRFDHKLQSAAYKQAVEYTTDVTINECEIIRLDPDDEVVHVSRSPDWDRTLSGLEHQFLGLCDEAQNVEYVSAIQRAKREFLGEDDG